MTGGAESVPPVNIRIHISVHQINHNDVWFNLQKLLYITVVFCNDKYYNNHVTDELVAALMFFVYTLNARRFITGR